MALPTIVIDYSVPGYQGLLNNVWNHFIVNDADSGVSTYSTNGGATGYRCSYNPGKPNRCAIGIFDTEKKLRWNDSVNALLGYDEWREVLQSMFAEFKLDLTSGTDHNFITDLQKAHDKSAVGSRFGQMKPKKTFKHELKVALITLANNYDLTIPGN